MAKQYKFGNIIVLIQNNKTSMDKLIEARKLLVSKEWYVEEEYSDLETEFIQTINGYGKIQGETYYQILSQGDPASQLEFLDDVFVETTEIQIPGTYEEAKAFLDREGRTIEDLAYQGKLVKIIYSKEIDDESKKNLRPVSNKILEDSRSNLVSTILIFEQQVTLTEQYKKQLKSRLEGMSFLFQGSSGDHYLDLIIEEIEYNTSKIEELEEKFLRTIAWKEHEIEENSQGYQYSEDTDISELDEKSREAHKAAQVFFG